MSFLPHPFTVVTSEPNPTTEELHGDSHVTSRGNSCESAIAIQDEAEARYAALMCDAEPDHLDEQTRREMDEWTAASELLNVHDRYGIERMSAVISKAWDTIHQRSMADFKAKLTAIVAPAPLVVQLAASLAFEQAKHDHDPKPAA